MTVRMFVVPRLMGRQGCLRLGASSRSLSVIEVNWAVATVTSRRKGVWIVLNPGGGLPLEFANARIGR